jgi:hypothetical protein
MINKASGCLENGFMRVFSVHPWLIVHKNEGNPPTAIQTKNPYGKIVPAALFPGSVIDRTTHLTPGSPIAQSQWFCRPSEA